MTHDAKLHLAPNAADLLARFDDLTPPDADALRELDTERGWVEAVRYFAERGMFTTDGEVEAANLLAASGEWAEGWGGMNLPSSPQEG